MWIYIYIYTYVRVYIYIYIWNMTPSLFEKAPIHARMLSAAFSSSMRPNRLATRLVASLASRLGVSALTLGHALARSSGLGV